MKEKNFLLLGVIAVAAIIISGCSPGSANANQTWPTYKNSDYGYVFSYPPDCTYGPLPEDCKGSSPEDQRAECLCFLNPENPDRVLMQTYHRDGEGQLILAEFQIVNITWFADNPPTATSQISDWLAENFPKHFVEAAFEGGEIGDVPVVFTSTQASEMAPATKEIFFLHKGHLFEIRLLNPDEAINHQLYESILRSFRFDG